VPSVPTYLNRQVQQAGIPNAQVGSQTSADTFGGGQSQAKVNDAVEGVADIGRTVALQEKQKADQVAFMQADRQASELQTSILMNVSKMKGQAAFGAPDVAAKQWSDSVAQIKDGLANSDQQAAFEKSANGRWEELNRTTQMHVAQQQTAFDEEQTKGYIEQSKNAATLGANDEDTVNTELQRQEAATRQWAERNGLSGTDAEKAKIAEVTSGTKREVVQARLDSGNTQGAIDYFNTNKVGMTSGDLLQAQKLIEDGKTLETGVTAWDQLKGMKLADGNPDAERMEKSIMSRDDLTTKEKLGVLAFVKARAGEEVVNKTRQDASNERSFMNTIVQGRQGGTSLEDALKQVKNFGTDPYDQTIKAEAVRKIYAPPTASNPETYISLWERVQDKNVNKEDIDTEMEHGNINASDWRTLREAYYKKITDGNDEKEKQVYERVKILAAEQFGSDKIAQAKFIYDLHQNNKGKPAADVWKDANDKLAPDPKSGMSLFGYDTGLFKSPQYKADVDRLDAQNLAWGKLHQDIGRKETNAIGQGILYSGKKSWSVGDVDAFAQNFGGYKNIQPGTPAHNAIQFLLKNNRLVTPDNVKAVMEHSQVGSNE
jgi:hypothetical protein